MSAEDPDVRVSGSQGVQAGSGNTMYNNWGPKPSLDPTALSGLSPHTAVDRLLKLTHDELVDFFAAVKPEGMSEIIEIFLYNERLKLIAALGDISRHKAAELIATIDASELLRALPDLAHEISREASSRRLANVGHIEPAQFPKGIVALAYFRRYENGRVWSSRLGTHVTSGLVDQCSAANFYLGVPVSDLKPAKSSPFGTNGLYQEFERGTVYSSGHRTFCVTSFSGAEECYRDQGGTGGWLGFPIDDYPTRPKPGILQKFEGGAIYAYTRVEPGATEQCAFAVRQNIISCLPKEGWFPVSKEISVISSSGKAGTVQRFEVKLEAGIHETAVYWGDFGEPAMISPKIWGYYTELGAEKSWLGLPKFKAFPCPSGVNVFDEGWVFWRSESEIFSVPNAIMKARGESGIGYPVSEVQPSGDDGSGRIQYFEKGVVTMRDGRYEVWTRPEPKHETSQSQAI